MLGLTTWVLDVWLMLAPVECEIEVHGVPASMLGYHRVSMAGRTWPARQRLVIPVPASPSEIGLVGPRFGGRQSISAELCAQGTIILAGVPHAARLVFLYAPADTVVRCLGCPGVDPTRYHFVDRFPSLALQALDVKLELILAARGHESRHIHLVLLPGENRIDARLEPLRGTLARRSSERLARGTNVPSCREKSRTITSSLASVTGPLHPASSSGRRGIASSPPP